MSYKFNVRQFIINQRAPENGRCFYLLFNVHFTFTALLKCVFSVSVAAANK